MHTDENCPNVLFKWSNYDDDKGLAGLFPDDFFSFAHSFGNVNDNVLSCKYTTDQNLWSCPLES